MSENVELYASILDGFERVLESVAADSWDNPSPCEGWTTRDVAGHAIGVVNNVAARGGVGELVDPFADVAAIAGDDPLDTLRQARSRYQRAIAQPGALQITVESRLGSMSLDEYIEQMSSDLLVHTWDVARAAGVDDTLDPAAVSVVYRSYRGRDPELLRLPGRYDDAVEIADSVSEQDLLIAFTGRTP